MIISGNFNAVFVICNFHVLYSVIPIKGIVEVTLTSDGCGGDVKFLEHVEAVVTMSASVRGQVNNQFCTGK